MALQQRISPHVTSLIRFKSGRPDGEGSRPMAGSGPVREGRGHAAVTNSRDGLREQIASLTERLGDRDQDLEIVNSQLVGAVGALEQIEYATRPATYSSAGAKREAHLLATAALAAVRGRSRWAKEGMS